MLKGLLPAAKPLYWIGGSRRDMQALPGEVQSVFGRALRMAQFGGKADAAKVLQGFGGAGVLEVVEDDSGGTYRAVYTVKFAGMVFVLHCFRACSKSFHGARCPAKAAGARRKAQPGWWPGEYLQRRRRCLCGATLRARQQTAALVVARLVQAASMDCGARLDCGLLLPCGHHEKTLNTLLEKEQARNRHAERGHGHHSCQAESGRGAGKGADR